MCYRERIDECYRGRIDECYHERIGYHHHVRCVLCVIVGERMIVIVWNYRERIDSVIVTWPYRLNNRYKWMMCYRMGWAYRWIYSFDRWATSGRIINPFSNPSQAEMYAGSIIIQQILGWNLWLSVCLLLGMATIYTVAGGLTAVIYIYAMQTVIMINGASILMGLGKELYELTGAKRDPVGCIPFMFSRSRFVYI